MHGGVARWLDEIQARFREAGDPVRAHGERAYLKSDLEFLGLTVPFIRATAQRFRRDFPDLAHDSLIAVATTLWAPPIHELRSLSIALLEQYRAALRPDDLALVERMVRDSTTWAHVDWVAVKLAGELVPRSSVGMQTLERWSRDPWMWLRRSALLALLEPLRAGLGDFETFERLASGMLGDKDFFIRKAIGWVLRDTSRRRPELTYAFLDRHLGEVSGLTVREGARHLPEAARAHLLRRYATRPTERR